MRHITYATSDKYPIAILVKTAAFNQAEIENAYIKRLENVGIDRKDVIVVSLDYNAAGKAPTAYIKDYLDTLMPNLESVGAKFIYCADANYFKVVAGQRKAEPHLGYSMPCALTGYTHMGVVLGVNHKSLMYNPANESKMLLSIDAFIKTIQGSTKVLGDNIIKYAYYPEKLEAIRAALNSLHRYPELVIDTETFSLAFDKAGVGTISFCWDDGHGIAFACDYQPLPGGKDQHGNYGKMVINHPVRQLIREFLEAYKGKIKYHNAPFDFGVLIYALWMNTMLDTEGLLTGLDILARDFEDTKIIAYLATNSTAGNELSLKDLAHPFAGNWAQDDIKDIRKIPLPELLKYNLIDGLATNWVYDKYYPIMVQDKQEDLYKELMLPSQKLITQIQLTGMPLSPEKVAQVRGKLEVIVAGYDQVFDSSAVIYGLTTELQKIEQAKANAKLKVKQHPLSHFAQYRFNPNSGPHLIKLLYEEMGLPVLDRTKTKLPATGGKTLEKLVHHTNDPDYLAVLEALVGYASAEKVLTSFIPAFEKAIKKGDGIVWLHGSFNLGGTVSGRLSSSDPNLQNIPAGSEYGKLIKECFVAPEGWLFGGADFNSLEDYISALTTRDPNKLKVYEMGYDGHCLRAFSYFPQHLPGIVDTVQSINSIKKLFPDIRQDSKAPTFALTYQGTYRTLMKNLGFDKATALSIETNYHELYKVSDQWVQLKLDEASKLGFVELAFGLRLRTPLLAQTLRGHRTTPHEAEAEGRTAGNALGQSYGLLNNRAAVDFMRKVWASEYRLCIKPVGLIHDAIYLVFLNNTKVIEWVNRELIKSMQWQELPEIKHDTVKLGAELSVFWPSWANEMVVPNECAEADIVLLSQQHQRDLQGEAA